MSNYDSVYFALPAPTAYLTLRNFENTAEVINVPMLLDTGADATLLPRIFVEKLGLPMSSTEMFELEAFDKTVSQSAVIRLQMIFAERSFRGEFLIIEQDYGIIGRNVLNSLKILFDGHKLNWEVLES